MVRTRQYDLTQESSVRRDATFGLPSGARPLALSLVYTTERGGSKRRSAASGEVAHVERAYDHVRRHFAEARIEDGSYRPGPAPWKRLVEVPGRWNRDIHVLCAISPPLLEYQFAPQSMAEPG